MHHVETERACELDPLGAAVEHRLRADVDGDPGDLAPAYLAPDLVGALQHDHLVAGGGQVVGGGQPGHTPADDHHAHAVSLSDRREPTARDRRPTAMTLTSPSRRLRGSALAAAGVAALVFVLGACSSGGDSDDGGGGNDSMAAYDADSPAAAAPESGADGTAANVDYAQDAPQQGVTDRAVISTATVALSSDDVAAARFDVQKIVDQFNGEVAEEQTEGGEEMRRSRVVIRVPSKDFSAAIEALEEVGVLESSTRKSEDVTTTVIDNAARIRAQEQSLQRVEVLLGQATSIRDIVAIEAQLTRRQADLDSLKSQQAFLADQTSLSTIRVLIERTSEAEKKEPDTDDSGFLSGLDGGWDALTSFGTGVATVAGALLPFAILCVLLGVPAWVVSRRVARRRPPAPAAPAGP